MATVEQRVTALETEFRTELKHLATKADLEGLKSDLRTDMSMHLRWLIGLQLGGLTAIAAIMKFVG